jgi:hypothetical protein
MGTLLAGLVLSGLAAAEAPRWLNHEGLLLDPNDNPVSGNVWMVFAIYDEGGPAPGNAARPSLWSQAQAVTVFAGRYTVLLGDPLVAPFTEGLFAADRELWLGVKVGDTELTPRLRIGATVFAFLADEAHKLGGLGPEGYALAHEHPYAAEAHDHAGVYAPPHDHPYALAAHDHEGVYAPTAHAHESAYAGLAHDHAGTYAPAAGSTAYAPAAGSTAYAPATGSTSYAPATGSTSYAESAHAHDSAYAGLTHDHDGVYAPGSHTHPEYMTRADVLALINSPPTLVAAYDYENNVLDQSFYQNNGTVSGATYVAGHAGQCLSFNGSQWMTAPNHASLNVGSGPFTLAAWIKNNNSSTGSWKRIITKRGNAGVWYSLAINSGHLTLELGGQITHQGSATVTGNAWHHVAAVRDTSQVRLYVDGALDTQGSSNAANLDNTQPLEVGNWNCVSATCECYDDCNFKGLIDNVRIYRRALTQSEIQSLMQ